MVSIMQEARAIEGEIIENRRWLHRHPEIGFDLPQTTAYVRERLEALGYEVREVCQSGLMVEVGSADRGPCVLVRADMDALPMAEQTELPFAADNGCMHACGHDGHTAMALGVAHLLKDREAELSGLVRIVFQPDEEGSAPVDTTGGDELLAAGVLENPTVDAVFAIHLLPTDIPCGRFATRKSTMFSSVDDVEVSIRGRGCHGSSPQKGIDPLNIACHIFLGFESLVARQLDPSDSVALTFGSMKAGSAANVIPDEAFMLGTLRTVSEQTRSQVQAMATSMVEDIGRAFGGSAEVQFLRGVPCVHNDPVLTDEVIDVITALTGDDTVILDAPITVSDDLAVLSQHAPTCYLLLGCGVPGKESFGVHSPFMEVDESVLSLGCAALTACALEYLESRAK